MGGNIFHMTTTETPARELVTIGSGKAIHIKDPNYTVTASPLCGGTRTNGSRQAIRPVYSPTAQATCKACLKLT
jgi:hypothetical protein